MRSKKAVYNVSTNLILQFVIVIYGFIVPKIIITSFGSNVNGLVSSITQFLAYITLLESGIGPVVKSSLYKPLANKDKNELINIIKTTEKFFRKIAYIFVFYIIILSFVYPLLVATEFDNLFTLSLIIIISISTFAEYYFGMTYRLLIQADQKTYIISFIQIATYILATISIIIMVKMNVSIQILKLVSGLIFVLRPFVQNIYVKKKYNLNFANYDTTYKLKNKWDGLAQHVASVIHNNTDIAVLTIFSTLVNVSIYSVYAIINKGIKSIIQSFTTGIDASWGDMIAKNENDILKRRFNTYEVIFFTITSIIYSCALILINPFIKVYTLNISDANYVLPTFGFLIVLSEYIWAIRTPYISVTYAAGHFKETRKGAWVECISNIIISVILVKKLGLIGVAIGTIIAMSLRTIEFIYHTNKYILKRSIWESIKKILIIIIVTTVVIVISNYLPYVENINYINWIINALMTLFISTITILIFNIIFNKKELKESIKLLGLKSKKTKEI